MSLIAFVINQNMSSMISAVKLFNDLCGFVFAQLKDLVILKVCTIKITTSAGLLGWFSTKLVGYPHFLVFLMSTNHIT